MPMKERNPRNRVSKADRVTGKIAGEPVSSGRNRVSKADRVAEKIARDQAPSGRSRVSKADEVVRKIDATTNPVPPASTRVRPDSKVAEISKKIPPKPASVSPNIPHTPQQPSSRISNPTEPRKGSGCCLLPFTLIVTAIIGVLTTVFLN